jgi:hypothetical protein
MTDWNRVKQAMVVGLGYRGCVRKATDIWLRFWEGIKKKIWFRFRILIGLFISVAVIAASYWVWSTWESWRINELASLSKTWPASNIPEEDGTVEITTKCSDSTLSYIVAIVPSRSQAGLTHSERTDSGRVVTDRIRNRIKTIRLQFVDRGGSPTAAYDLPIDEFIRIYSSSDERPTSLEARGTLACSPASYVRADTLRLSWIEWSR